MYTIYEQQMRQSKPALSVNMNEPLPEILEINDQTLGDESKSDVTKNTNPNFNSRPIHLNVPPV